MVAMEPAQPVHRGHRHRRGHDPARRPALDSGILLTAIASVALNLYFNGSKGGAEEAVAAARMAEAH